jgi:hypothetical protein
VIQISTTYIANDCDDEKREEPGMVVTVSFPAFIISGSTFSAVG